ncbi:hypothetical protein STRIP9103_04004 [Streptomyces ipomoeae 91-03]|uniref:Uncharacterized protein n=1 Tax=Streptomyces ipomoeae 91-03 TaxID=698759 RepID=L1KKG0_9ACTN|nr:hypothetical protein STRIP9103_04004 [Streptomyces ipomoeae 91-03]
MVCRPNQGRPSLRPGPPRPRHRADTLDGDVLPLTQTAPDNESEAE